MAFMGISLGERSYESNEAVPPSAKALAAIVIIAVRLA
jgi:hypothetical protein